MPTLATLSNEFYRCPAAACLLMQLQDKFGDSWHSKALSIVEAYEQLEQQRQRLWKQHLQLQQALMQEAHKVSDVWKQKHTEAAAQHSATRHQLAQLQKRLLLVSASCTPNATRLLHAQMVCCSSCFVGTMTCSCWRSASRSSRRSCMPHSRSGSIGVAAAVTKRQHNSPGKQQGPSKRTQAKGGGQKRPRVAALFK